MKKISFTIFALILPTILIAGPNTGGGMGTTYMAAKKQLVEQLGADFKNRDDIFIKNNGELRISKHSFIDAKNSQGEIKPKYSLKPSEAQVHQKVISINLNTTDLTDVQLQDGRIIRLK